MLLKGGNFALNQLQIMTVSLAPPCTSSSLRTKLPASLCNIINRLRTTSVVQPVQLKEIIAAARVKAEDLQPWADYKHPLADSYGRKLVYQDENFEVMVMSWAPGDFSAIHDHGYTEWGAVQIFGPAEHATFTERNGQLETLNRWLVQTGDIVTVNHDLIHQMGNPTANRHFLSLHIYGHHEQLDNITGDARIYELDQGLIQRVDGGVFFALPPADIKRTEAGPQGDYPTTLRHRTELLRRILKLRQAGQWDDEAGWLNLLSRTFNQEFHRQLAQLDTQSVSRKDRLLRWELQVASQLLETIKNTGL
jgi:predicted metal-dependent enzyme (double-stranded beta helix superfamily)